MFSVSHVSLELFIIFNQSSKISKKNVLKLRKGYPKQNVVRDMDENL